MLDLERWGYVEEEFFLHGRAQRFQLAPGTAMGIDGRWDAVPVDVASYRTRMLVLRPREPGRFNGHVIVHWNNVSAGYDLIDDSVEIVASGSARVAVTTQRVGLDGLPPTPQGLKQWDPTRYGDLDIEDDDLSFDIFTQAARCVGPARQAGGVDPMAGLPVRTITAEGSSQSAARLATYVNAVHPLDPVFNAFLLLLYMGTATPPDVGEWVLNLGDGSYEDRRRKLLHGAHRIRDDVPARVMIVNSELESTAFYPVRQPDSGIFRLWEAAGTAHTSRPSQLDRAPRLRRDGIPSRPPLEGMNDVCLTPLFEAARRHLRRWAEGGAPPPSGPRIDISGDPATIARDDWDIAIGGIRLPGVEAPLAVHSALPLGPDVVSWLSGSSTPLPPAQLRARYGDLDGYLEQLRAATAAAVQAGILLSRDADGELTAATEHARELFSVIGGQVGAPGRVPSNEDPRRTG
jgi:hypothetical protein